MIVDPEFVEWKNNQISVLRVKDQCAVACGPPMTGLPAGGKNSRKKGVESPGFPDIHRHGVRSCQIQAEVKVHQPHLS